MPCFDLTKGLCDEISNMICRFWWSQQENENKMHRLSWEVLSCRKDKGGLGYRDLHLFNLAMLPRQGWHLLLNQRSLCAQVLRAKYFPSGDLLSVIEKPGISYSWRSIVRRVQTLKDGLIWRVGDGTQINIWLDPWIPNGVTRRPATPRGHIIVTKVSELVDPTMGEWDSALVKDICSEQDAKNILAIPLKQRMMDNLAWHFDSKGRFSVKSAYHVLADNRDMKKNMQKGESSNTEVTGTSFKWSNI